MLELADALLPRLRAGEAVAVVTVTRVARSAPRGPGAAMAVFADGSVVGSISGGCVEGDAVLLATGVLASGRAVTATLGFSDDVAHAAGLACGGSVDVVVHRVGPADAVALAALEAPGDRRMRVGIVLEGARAGSLVAEDALNGDGPFVDHDGARTFVVTREPRPHLIVAGAGEHAIALARVASAAGFTVTVGDVWERLVTPERFPTADRLVVGVPADELSALIGEAWTAVCVLSHDERVDVPALATALRAGADFVGAMGARSTVTHRARLLAEAGVADADIARIHSPLGLDLGGSSPEETALSVLAEITAARRGGSAQPLRATRGPIHARAAAASCAPTR